MRPVLPNQRTVEETDERDDREGLHRTLLTDAAAHFETVETGHADITDDGGGRDLAETPQPFVAIACRMHKVVGGCQREQWESARLGVVVDDEHAVRRSVEQHGV
jgi:hypothetical protein